MNAINEKQKLNILQINSSSFWGGGEAHVYNLVEKLSKDGHNITLVIKKELLPKFKNLNIDIVALPLLNMLDVYSMFKIKKIIKKKNIDIVHVHRGIDYWMGTLPTIKNTKVKVVATRHIQSSLGNSYFHKKLYSKIDKFIAVSTSIKEILVNKNNISPRLVEVIYNGLDFKEKTHICKVKRELIKKDLNIKEKDFVIGLIGRLSEEKNQELVIKAIRNLVVNYSIKLLIVGQDNSKGNIYKKRLEKYTNLYNLKDNCIFTGFKENVYDYLDICDVIIVPSVKEAFGIVAIEAMSIKKLVIASDIGGLNEIIKHKDNGFLFPVNDVNTLTKLILKVINNAGEINPITRRAYEYARCNFSLGNMISKTKKLYYQIREKE